MLRALPRTIEGMLASWRATFAIAALLTLAAALLGLRLQEDGIAVFWPAAGVGLGLMLLAAPSSRWSVAAGMLLALSIGNFTQSRSIPASLVFMTGNILQSWLGATLLERFAGRPFTLGRLPSAAAFIAVAVVLPAIVGAFVAPGLFLAGHIKGAVLEACFTWFASQAVGVLSFAPAVLSLGRLPSGTLGLKDLVQAVAVAVFALVVIGSFGPGSSLAVVVGLTLILPVVVWVVLGVGKIRAAMAVLAVAAITMWQTSSEAGLFAASVHGAQVFLALFSILLLLLGAWRPATDGFAEERDGLPIHRAREVQAAVTLVPLVLFVAIAWWSWKATEKEAFARVNRLSSALAEHAERIVESQQTATEAALAHVRGRSSSEIASDPRVREFLVRLAGSTAMDEAISLVSLSDGKVLAESAAGATPGGGPAHHVSERDFLAAFASGASGTLIGRGAIADGRRLAFSVSRFDPANGVVAVAYVPLEELLSFYRAVREDAADAITLVRDDGEVLARVPDPSLEIGYRLPPEAPAWRWMRSIATGPAIVRSSVDGRVRIARALKVAEFSVSIYYGLDYAEIRSSWLRQIAPFAALSLLGSALIALGFRQAGRAEIAKASAELDAERTRIALHGANALLASEERYRLLVEQADDGIFVADASGRYINVNPAGCRMLGYARDELLGLSIADVVSPGEVARIAPEVARFAGGAVARSEWQFLRKDGSVFIGEVVGRQLADGRLQAFVRDITDRKEVEETLRRSARQAEELALARLLLASIVDSTDDAVMSFDVEGRVTSWNKGAERLFGFTEAEALSLKADLLVAPLGRILPGEGPSGAFDQALSGERFQRDTVRVAKDGTIIDVSVTANQLRTPDGRVIGVSAIMRDIRERKRIEVALNDSRKDLERAQAVAQTGSWRLDVTRNELTWSSENYRLFDIPRGTHLTYESFLDTVHPDDREYVDRHWKAALAGIPYDIEHRIVAGGRIRFVRERAELEFDAQGRLLGGFGTSQDITERKHIEETLRARELLLRTAADNASVGLVMLDDARRYTFVNAPYTRLLGLPLPVHELIGKSPREVLAEVYETQISPHLDEAFAGRRVTYELNRGESVFNVVYDPVYRDTSKVEGVIVTIFDISDIKRAEQTLRESEERLRLTNEAAGIGTFMIDIAGRTAHYSPELAVMLGFPHVTSTPVELAFARIHRDDLPRIRALYEAAHDPAGDGRLRMEFRFVRPGGEIRWMTWNGKVEFRDEPAGRRPVRILGACVDTTERKRAEEHLKTSEERLRAIVDTAVDAIIVSDETGIIQSVNPAAERMFGNAASELVGRNVSVLMTGPDRADHDGYMESYLRTGEGRIIGRERREVTGLRRDGSTFNADLAIVEWYASGERYFTAILRDITERKRSERQIRELLAEVNHRAKNLLGVVQAIALQTAASDPADFLERFSERIQGLAASQDLLVQSRWQGIELDSLVRSQLSHFRDLIGTRIAIEGPPVRISASAAQTIGMALHELATNAGKYGALSTSTGRVTVGWSLDHVGSDSARFSIFWTERDGPPVDMPSRRGFGTTVIETMPKLSLNASVTLRFDPEGLTWTCTCPSAAILESAQPVTSSVR